MDILAFVLGTILGSFANVIILRMPRGESIVLPRSHCPHCQKTLAWYMNVPLVSWLFLRAKCAYCQGSISIRYPLVELVMGLLFWLCWLRFGPQYFLIEALIFTFGVVTASVIDLDHYILPDEFTLGGLAVALIGAAINPERSFVDACLGVLVGGGVFWAFAFLYVHFRKQEGLGGGDVKLLAWIGALLGLSSILFVIVVASLAGAGVGLYVALRSQKGLKAVIPFGPFLSTGALVYMLWGEELVAWYIQLFIPSN